MCTRQVVQVLTGLGDGQHLIARLFAVLDGLTLAHLERTGSDKSLYGRERVYGAVSWGIAHILFGPLIDALGFRVLYFTTVIAFCGCVVVFRIFAAAVLNDGYERIGSALVEADVDIDVCDPTADQLSSPLGAPIATRRSSVEKIEPPESNASQNYTLDSSPERLTFVSIAKILLRTAPVNNTSYVIAMFTLFVGMSGKAFLESASIFDTIQDRRLNKRSCGKPHIPLLRVARWNEPNGGVNCDCDGNFRAADFSLCIKHALMVGQPVNDAAMGLVGLHNSGNWLLLHTEGSSERGSVFRTSARGNYRVRNDI